MDTIEKCAENSNEVYSETDSDSDTDTDYNESLILDEFDEYIKQNHCSILDGTKFILKKNNYDKDVCGSLLHYIYEKNDIESVKYLLQLTIKKNDLNFAINRAFIEKEYHIVQILIDHGVKIDPCAYTITSFISKNDADGQNIIRKLIEYDVDIHAKDDLLFTTLCLFNCINTIRFLLDLNVNIYAEKNLAIYNAVITGNLDVVKLLLENGASIKIHETTLFIKAAFIGNLPLLKLLLENGDDPHAYNDEAIVMSCLYNHYETTKFLIEIGLAPDAQNGKPFTICMQGDKDDLAILLIKNFPDINKVVGYPGYYAAVYGRNSILKLLIDIGYDISYQNKIIVLTSAIKHLATYETVKLLIENGANIYEYTDIEFVNKKGERKTQRTYDAPLVTAIIKKEIDMVNLLLENAANVNVSDGLPIIMAIHHKSYDITKLLIKYGADLTIQNNLPIRIAVKNNLDEIINLLIENGANLPN